MSDWPAFAYIYGTWGYALARAIEHSKQRHQKVYVFKVDFPERSWWVVSWDPKSHFITNKVLAVAAG